MSPLLSPSRYRNVSNMRGADFSHIPSADTTLSSNSGLRAESESSFVLSTNDCLHFQVSFVGVNGVSHDGNNNKDHEFYVTLV